MNAIATTKICTKCHAEKPLNDFHKDRARKDGLYPCCRPCAAVGRRESRKRYPSRTLESMRAAKKLYDQRHPGRASLRNHRTNLWYAHKMTVEQYAEMLDAQGGVCAICNQKCKKRLSVDHDHITGEIRGLLCRRCNLVLGEMLDSVELMSSAIQYLRRHGHGEALCPQEACAEAACGD